MSRAEGRGYDGRYPRVSRGFRSTHHGDQSRWVSRGADMGRSRGPQVRQEKERQPIRGAINSQAEYAKPKEKEDNRRFTINNHHHHFARTEEKADHHRQQPKIWENKSFRSLFSDRDIEKGGDWEEVRRRRSFKQRRERFPIIKQPCFRCGLGGHFRRNCPKRFNMRCYGCGSATHLLRSCMASGRPEEVKLEFDTVFDIDDRVRTLNNFAIFRTLSGAPNEYTLKEAVAEELWELGWRGKVIPISRGSFLVEFVNDYQRDMAVRKGKMEFDGFSGKFYAWGEDIGVAKVSRPVFIWLKLDGLPLQCWGEEEIKKIVGEFGKLIQISDNFYRKTSADVVRVMVEVEDISAIPKVVRCSYKAISDDAYRSFVVALTPSSQGLPCSQVNQDNFRLFEVGGGLSEAVEERWSSGSEVAKDGVAGAVDRMEKNAAVDAGVHEEPEIADPLMQTDHNAAAVAEGKGNVQSSSLQRDKGGELSPAAVEKLRKGKGPMCEEGPVRSWADFIKPTDLSGSDSCELMEFEIQGGGFGAGDADSLFVGHVIGPSDGPGGVVNAQERSRPVNETCQSKEDEEKRGNEEVLKGGKGEAMVVDKGKGKEKMGSAGSHGGLKEKSRSTSMSVSVPPGFQKIDKSRGRVVSGAASPFGKLQRGAFKYIKRPAGSSSLLKSDASIGKKSKLPLSKIPKEAFNEVAVNVGIKLPLNDEQIAFLKSLEEERASS